MGDYAKVANPQSIDDVAPHRYLDSQLHDNTVVDDDDILLTPTVAPHATPSIQQIDINSSLSEQHSADLIEAASLSFLGLFARCITDPTIRRLSWHYMKEILDLAWPVVASYVMGYALNVVNIVFVGHLSPTYLGAAALGNATANVSGYSVMIGLAGAMDTLCSNAFGANNKPMVALIALRCAMFLTVASAPIYIVWFYGSDILLMAKQDPEIAALAGHYLRQLIPALFPATLYEVGKKYLQSQQVMRPMLVIGLVANLVHAFACWLFIFRFEWGFTGAPIATVVTIWFEALCMLVTIYLLRRRDLVCMAPLDMKFKDLFCGWTPIIKLGVPGMLMLCGEWWGIEFCNLIAGTISKIDLDAFVVTISLMAFLFMFPLGIQVSITTLTGNLLGAQQPREARMASFIGICLGIGMVAVNGSLLFIFRSKAGAIFSSDELVLNHVALITPMAAIMCTVDGIQTVEGGVLRGAGKQGIGAVTNFVAYYVLCLPIASVAVFVLKVDVRGVFMGLITAASSQGIIYLILIARLDWQREAQKAKERVDEEERAKIATQPDTEGGMSMEMSTVRILSAKAAPSLNHHAPVYSIANSDDDEVSHFDANHTYDDTLDTLENEDDDGDDVVKLMERELRDDEQRSRPKDQESHHHNRGSGAIMRYVDNDVE